MKRHRIIYIALLLCIVGCRTDDYIVYMEDEDMGIVAQTILLAAVDMGLGGCMIGNFVRAEVSAALDLPEHLEPLLVVALGKPDEEIVLTDLPEDGNTNYYRDADDVHYVPKRALEDLII